MPLVPNDVGEVLSGDTTLRCLETKEEAVGRSGYGLVVVQEMEGEEKPRSR
jgi:hypothetical protein